MRLQILEEEMRQIEMKNKLRRARRLIETQNINKRLEEVEQDKENERLGAQSVHDDDDVKKNENFSR